MRFAQNCSVNYTSGVQYTAKAKELQALAYAVAALTGCGSSGSTNEFFDHMVWAFTIMYIYTVFIYFFFYKY